jgi:hypothetical protein
MSKRTGRRLLSKGPEAPISAAPFQNSILIQNTIMDHSDQRGVTDVYKYFHISVMGNDTRLGTSI